jgi:hypothetical protein
VVQGDLLEVRRCSAAEDYARRYTGVVVSQLIAHASDRRLSDWDRQFLADMDSKIARYRGLFLSDKQVLVVLRIEDKLCSRTPVELIPPEDCGLGRFG